MKWKKYLTISISILVLLFSKQILHACGGMFNYYQTSVHFFGNKAPDKPVYFPFNFTPYDVYYGGYYETQSTMDSLNKNLLLEEWQSFLKNGIKVKEIEPLLYGGDTATFVKIKEKKRSSSENPFVRYLEQKGHSEVLNYLIYAKECEVNAGENADYWPSEKQKPTVSNEVLEKEGLQAIQTIKTPLLRMKYAFQIMRMAFYDRQYEKVLQLYDQLIKKQGDKSIAFTRIIGLRAGAYYHLGNKVKAGYYYTRMFDNNDAYKFDAMVSFQWALNYHDENNFDAIYALCKTKHEKAVALVMKTLHTSSPDLKDVEKAYALDPTTEGIDVLMNREVNKLEKVYFSKKIQKQNKLQYPEYTYIWGFYHPASQHFIDSLKEKYSPYIDSLNAFTDQLIKDNKANNSALWYLVKAYLACMQDKPVAIGQQLQLAQQAGMTVYEKALYNMISLLHIIYKTPDITAVTEKEMLPGLKHLNKLSKKELHAQYQFEHFMYYLVAGKYFQQGDTIKGVYAMAHSERYWNQQNTDYGFYASPSFEDLQGEVLNGMSIADLKKVLAFRTSSSKSPYERWLVDSTYYTTSVLNDLLATKYIRKGDFNSAVSVLEKTEGSKRTFPDPFMPHINDIHWLGSIDPEPQYTKLQYSKRMAALQKAIAGNPNDAGALYGYALALYNTSYYGRAGDIISYNRHSTDRNGYFKWTSDKRLPHYLKEYYRAYQAEKYFLRAAKAASDQELEAKALWGAAKCWEKRCPMNFGVADYYRNYNIDYDSVYLHHAFQNPYFEKLKAHYRTTKFMKEVRGTCDYYSLYITR